MSMKTDIFLSAKLLKIAKLGDFEFSSTIQLNHCNKQKLNERPIFKNAKPPS